MKRLLLLALLLVTALATAQNTSACGPLVAPEPLTSHDLDAEKRTELLDEIFALIRQEHYDPTFGGVDLDELRQRYEPQVLAAEDDGAVYQLLNDMAAEVNSDVYPPQANSSAGAGFSGIGAFVNRAADGNALEVVGLFSGAPAESAGLQRGDLILAVDGNGNCPIIDNILGNAGTPVTLTVQSPGEEPREVTIVRALIQADPVVESYRLPNHPEISYLWVPNFFQDNVSRNLTSALTNLGIRRQDPDLPAGLIFDLRGMADCSDNQLRAAMTPLFSGPLYYYVEAPGAPADEVQLGPSAIGTRQNALVQQVPLALLVNGGTRNCFEALAGTLQMEGLALVVGMNTAGETLRGLEFPLPGDAALSVPDSEEVLPDGTSILGTGVTPDVRVDVENASPYVPGSEDDPFIQAAVRALQRGVR